MSRLNGLCNHILLHFQGFPLLQGQVLVTLLMLVTFVKQILNDHDGDMCKVSLWWPNWKAFCGRYSLESAVCSTSSEFMEKRLKWSQLLTCTILQGNIIKICKKFPATNRVYVTLYKSLILQHCHNFIIMFIIRIQFVRVPKFFPSYLFISFCYGFHPILWMHKVNL